MACEILYILQCGSLQQEIGDRCNSEGMWGVLGGQAGIVEPAFDHAADVLPGDRGLGELAGPAVSGAKQRAIAVSIGKVGGGEVIQNATLQIMANRDFP